MDLPIDHFRLLGVPPSADAKGVLRTLQSRLDRLPNGGFTPETLQARAELLRASADLLSDYDRRAAYEAELTGLADTDASLQPALEIATARQVGGLLLLMEGGGSPWRPSSWPAARCSRPSRPPSAVAAKPISCSWLVWPALRPPASWRSSVASKPPPAPCNRVCSCCNASADNPTSGKRCTPSWNISRPTGCSTC